MHKLFAGSIVVVLCILGSGARGSGQEAHMPRGELRIVDNNPGNWVSITFNVFEHLMELDKDGALVPRLATSWQWLDDRTLEVTLRQGVTFHNARSSTRRLSSSTGRRIPGYDSLTSAGHS